MFIISKYFWSVQFFFLTVDFKFHSVVVQKCTGCDINLLVPVVPVEGWFVVHDIIYSGECPMCTWKECVFCFRKKYSDYICGVPVVQCVKAIVHLLIFCIDDRSIAISVWVLKSPVIGIPGWRSGLAPAFGPGRDPGVPGSSPTSGYPHGACFSLCLCLCLSVCVSLMNK